MSSRFPRNTEASKVKKKEPINSLEADAVVTHSHWLIIHSLLPLTHESLNFRPHPGVLPVCKGLGLRES